MSRASLTAGVLLSVSVFCGCGSEENEKPSPQTKNEQGDAGQNPASTPSRTKETVTAAKPAVAAPPIAAGQPIDLAYLPDGYAFVAVLHPQRILNNPAIQPEMREVVAEGMAQAVRDAGPARDIVPDISRVQQALVMVDSQLMEMMLAEGIGGSTDDKEEAYHKEEVFEERGLKGGDFEDEDFDLKSGKFDEKGFESDGVSVEKEGVEIEDEEIDEEGFESDGFGEKGFDEKGFDEKGFEGPSEGPREIPNFVIHLRYVEPIDFTLEAQRLLFWGRDVEPREIEGRSCYVSDSMGLGCLRVDEHSIAYTSLANLPVVIKADPNSDDPLKNELRSISGENDFIAAFVLPDQLRLAAGLMAGALGGELPPDFQALTKLPASLKTVSLQVNLSGQTLAQLQVKLKDAEVAKQLVSTTNSGLDIAKHQLATDIRRQPAGAGGEAAVSLASDLLNNVSVGQDATQVTVSLAAPENLNERVAVLLQEAQKAAEQARQSNQLKMVGLAFYNYSDTFGQLPPVRSPEWYDKEGKPYLSWRVHILPFLEHGNLYDQFKLDEPWDSEHNLKLLEHMPDGYRTIGDSTQTTLLMVVGEGTAYEGGEGLQSFRQFTDGTSNTILVVRASADKAVPWTKPADMPFNLDDPAAALGKIEGDHILVLLADGSVQRLPKDIAPEQLRALLTRNGGEEVEVPGRHGISGSASFDSGAPISGGSITFENEDTKVKVPIREDGTYKGPALPEGSYSIEVDSDSSRGASKSPDN